jgi:hypothetical protein
MAQSEMLLFLPLISRIYDTQQRDDTRSTERSYFFEKLEGEFGDLAEEQLDDADNHQQLSRLSKAIP